MNRFQSIPRPIRVVGVAAVGSATLLAGAAMLVLPGPGIAVVLLGLGILATEFTWARRSLGTLRHHGRRLIGRRPVSAGRHHDEKGTIR